jgi:hypothetical protein
MPPVRSLPFENQVQHFPLELTGDLVEHGFLPVLTLRRLRSCAAVSKGEDGSWGGPILRDAPPRLQEQSLGAPQTVCPFPRRGDSPSMR